MYKFIKDETGATAIEYALIAALVALGLVVGAAAVGTNLNNLFEFGAKELNESN